jgi:hypothetical protein
MVISSSAGRPPPGTLSTETSPNLDREVFHSWFGVRTPNPNQLWKGAE